MTRKSTLLQAIASARREWAKFRRLYPEGTKVATLTFPKLKEPRS